MINQNNFFTTTFALVIGFILLTCFPQQDTSPNLGGLGIDVPSDFNYETLRTVPTSLSFSYGDLPMALERFELYADESANNLLFTGVTDTEGNFIQDLVFPIDMENIYVKFSNQSVSTGRTNGAFSIIINDAINQRFTQVIEKVMIESIELDDENEKCKWRVRNPFSEKLNIDYSLPNLGENGRHDAPQGDSFFYTKYSKDDCGKCNDKSEHNAIVASFLRAGIKTGIESFSKCFCDEGINYYTWPSIEGMASFVYEDLWPNQGDYDMNDVVVNTKYSIKYKIVDSKTKVKELTIFYQLKHSGTGYQNGFAVQLPVGSEVIQRVTGTLDNPNIELNFEENGVESGQSLATIIIFEETRDLVNQFEYNNPSEIKEVTVKFKKGISVFDLANKFPFNPFIFNSDARMINGTEVPVRALEVHLPKKTPTDLADMTLFALEQENGDPKYLSNPGRYPWALVIPMSFEYPIEYENISNAYPRFEGWVASGGNKKKSWYKFPKEELVIKN